MIQFLNYLKIAPFIIAAVAGAWFAHKFIVGQYEQQVAQLELNISQYVAQNVALQAAAETNIQTIRGLEDQIATQTGDINNLIVNNQQLQTEKEEYLNIFRRHDLTRLALARPGLIEPRINNGTQEVFRELEEASRRIGEPNE